jgi:hypothetical protein
MFYDTHHKSSELQCGLKRFLLCCMRVCKLQSGTRIITKVLLQHAKKYQSQAVLPVLFLGLPGSVSERYGSGSGPFYHQAKIVRKTFIPTVS